MSRARFALDMPQAMAADMAQFPHAAPRSAVRLWGPHHYDPAANGRATGVVAALRYHARRPSCLPECERGAVARQPPGARRERPTACRRNGWRRACW